MNLELPEQIRTDTISAPGVATSSSDGEASTWSAVMLLGVRLMALNRARFERLKYWPF